ncbi:hypothetical protein [Bradyrhizobium sp. Ai1a-2]|uniref:hypothetical protein n=1 Tax=Bradyrhizobium sp. Ai1a-2 TaxID=196490 RepID=UPI00041B1A6E|nr:hypothetical protein [Bradyrhizobium sp. Ai1a-2]
MREIIGAVILAALFAGRAATAETVGMAKPSSAAVSSGLSDTSSRTGLPWPAPVGHRQPHAKDLPSQNTNELEQISEEDRAVDRRLTICHGC